jgi:hypothetical protein
MSKLAALTTFKIYVPELGFARPIRAILDCPERIYVAWHRHALGIYELLDADGRGRYGPPQDDLWEVREYVRAIHYPEAGEAFYDAVTA